MKYIAIQIGLILKFNCNVGTLFQPIAYTLPDGLQSANGSSATGGCQENCVMMPISGTTINGCDCPGTTPVSGVLIDGDIPSIDTTQHGTWASGLFVVNRNGQDSFVIGFEFSSYFFLGELEVTYFDCPIWGAGVNAINVYSSFVFPSFISAASTNIGMLSLVGDISPSCTSLRTISIPVQATESVSNYYIEYFFAGGSSVHPLNWLHIGEIRFSDMHPSALITTTTAADIQTTKVTNALTESTEPTSMHVTDSTNQIKEAGTTSVEEMVSTVESLFTDGALTTPSQSDAAATPVTTIIGALVGVIVLLLLLIVVSTTLMVGFFVYNKRKMKKDKSSEEPQYAVIEIINSCTSLEHRSSTENEQIEMRRTSTALNSLYQQSVELSPPDISHPVVASTGQGNVGLYSEIRDMSGDNAGSVNEEADSNSDLSENSPENHYAIIPEIYTLAVDTSTNMHEDSPVNHYAIIPETYTLASPIVGLSETAKHADQDSPSSSGLILQAKPTRELAVCETNSGSHDPEGNAAAPEDQRSYTLVHKQTPPPVPEKSRELQ